ncbi:MAG: carbohydrate ABC transporter permease [Thermaceae bacterium]|nr:carbohydrate ABC transporter permease [Thermaceae bacterium]
MRVPQMRRALLWILVLALGFFLLMPLLTLVLWAFADVWRYPSLLPQMYSLKWWNWVFHNGNLGKSALWSFTTAPVVVLLAWVICLPAAYAFSRLNFPGKRFFFVALLAADSFPRFGIYISVATLFFQWGLIGNYWGVVLVQLINVIVTMTWIPTAGFDGVPRELEEAARDSGANPLQVFWRVTLPLALPSILVASILAFLSAFDEAQGTLVVGAPDITTLPVLMYSLVANYPEPVGAVFSILLSIPNLLLLIFARRILLSGYLAAGFGVR